MTCHPYSTPATPLTVSTSEPARLPDDGDGAVPQADELRQAARFEGRWDEDHDRPRVDPIGEPLVMPEDHAAVRAPGGREGGREKPIMVSAYISQPVTATF